ncbi:lipid A deacylase LpxR family protein [Fulvivirga sp. RKSG066]|nr:lipid A deacylase LpxR family protein [Fulvivirga aurantia]MTI21367.1 lipid A deacylase LpxR family protein [Fulvivirga aurantia]
MDRELNISYDNDLYFGTDRYYTSGLDIIHRRLLKANSPWFQRFKSRRNDSTKVIAGFHYGHKIFTPYKIKRKNVEDFDRPYAGWHYLKLHMQNFPGANSMNSFSLELGVVGEMSGIGNFQEWWHEKLSFPQPQGWKYQVGNEVILNLVYKRSMQWSPVRRIGLYSDTEIKLGTGMNRATQSAELRYGKANRLFNSAKANSRLSHKLPVVGNNDPEEEEGYLFYGIEGQYVLSNIFIEGSLLRAETPHTEELEDVVIVRKWGFVYSNYYTTFSFTVYRMTPENKGARKHRFINLNLAFRF